MRLLGGLHAGPGGFSTNGRGFVRPTDLREIVLEEVARLDWQNPEVVDYLSRYPDYHPQTLLSVLAFAYAMQDFESEGIASACDHNPDFQALSGGRMVRAQDLINFRRSNRALLEVVLGKVLRQASAVGRGRLTFDPDADDEEVYRLEARRRLDIARHFDSLD
jgi:hypothetical protein